MPKKHQLTREGLERLQKELENLQNISRVEIAEKLKIAIAYGDLSENSEYQSARDEQAAIEMRISEIEDIFENYEILDIDKKAKKNNTVTIGSTFTLGMDGVKKVFTLVGSTEADILQNRISNESPIGMAVIGKSAWEEVEGVAHSGPFHYKLIDIS